jgi:uncharacterized protein YjbI with pentapeptide repeats
MIFAEGAARMDYIGFELDVAPDTFSIASPDKTARYSDIYSKYTNYSKEDESLANSVFDEDEYMMRLRDTDLSNSTFNHSTIHLAVGNGGLFYDDSVHERRYSIEDSDLSGSVFNDATIETDASYDNESDIFTFTFLLMDAVRYSIENSDFSDTIFDGGALELDMHDSDFSNADFIDADLTLFAIKSDFIKTDFTTSTIRSIQYYNEYGRPQEGPSYAYASDFTGANFQDMDLSSLWAGYSTFKYANFEGAKYPEGLLLNNHIGNAWAPDGTRCNAASIGYCIPKIWDNGLTYEEYLQGKTDLEKDAEVAYAEAQKKAEEAVSFVTETISSWW